MIGNGNCRLLILDCDGVLIRSEAANLAYYNHIFEEFGMPVVRLADRDELRRLHTMSTPQVIESFFPEAQWEEVAEYAANLPFEPFTRLIEPEPGWAEVLREWVACGKWVAVATNRGASAETVLEAVGLTPFLHEVVTIKRVARPKPHPDLLLKVLELLQIAPQESLYVGDSDLDRAAASAAGIPFLGFRHPLPPSVDSAEGVGQWLQGVAPHDFSDTLQDVK